MKPGTSVRYGHVSKTQVSAALGPGLIRAQKAAGGKGSLADRLDSSTKTIDRALTGESVPEFHTLLSMLAVDHTSLDEAMALVGCKVTLRRSDAANDMTLVTDLSAAATEFIRRLSDGRRCHVDTGVLAELFRHLIPQMQAIVDESDERRAA